MGQLGRFDEKVVLVTGATSGIGRAAALMLAERGANLIAASRRREQGDILIKEARAKGAKARFVTVDIADEASIDALFATIATEYGRLDAAFNNAGVEADFAPLPDAPVEDFHRVFSTNVRGTWLCLRHELRMMREQGAGVVLNTASIAGIIAYPNASIYTASKHAIVGMSKAAGLDFAEAGIRVNCLCPGATRSEMSARWASMTPGGEAAVAARLPMKRIAEAEEQAEVALFLLSDAASNMNSATIAVDGGRSVI